MNPSKVTDKVNKIRNELLQVFRERCLKSDMGFQDEGSEGRWDIPWTDIITRVDTSYVSDDMEITDISSAAYAKIEVGVELDYDGMSKISEVGDNVLYKYDKEAYFDSEAPGILVAYLNLSNIRGITSTTDVQAAEDVAEVIPAEDLAGMSKDDMYNFLEGLPIGTKLSGIVDAPGTFGRKRWGDDDKIIVKAGGYTGPYYNRYGLSPADTKYQDTWWTISGNKVSTWDIVGIIRGKSQYYSVKALEDTQIESSTNVEAAMDYMDHILDPTERWPDGQYPGPKQDEVGTQGEIDLELDAIINMDNEGGWEYEDTEYPWANSTNDGGRWFADTEYGDIYVGDPDDIVENVDKLLEVLLPMKAGRYHIHGFVTLVYDIDNILEYDTRSEWNDEMEYYVDDSDVHFNYQKSDISKFSCDKA